MNSELDLDLLADYAAGLLDPEAADAVRRELARDPHWAATLTRLTAAGPLLDTELASLGEVRMPDSVADRITAALTAAGADLSTTGLAGLGTAGEMAGAGGAGTRGSDGPEHDGGRVIPLTRSTGILPAPRRSARRAGRRGRLVAAGLGVAAAVVLFVGGFAVLGNLSTGVSHSDSAAGTTTYGYRSTDKAAAPQNGSGAAGAARPVPVVTSGRDYQPSDLPGQISADSALAAADAAEVPDELRRLLDPVAQASCLQQLAVDHPGQLVLLDFARFQGRAAVVVLLEVAAGVRVAVVVGPDCGLAGKGADVVFASPTR